LPTFVAAIFQQPPNYEHLTGFAPQAETDALAFRQTLELLKNAGISPKTTKILDLACGPLATQTLLFNSAGYNIIGVDLHIPPAYLPAASLAQRLFQRGKYVQAWKTATAAYYQALAQYAGLKLKWNGVKIELADLTRLQFPEDSFEAVICHDHLHHAPDVEGLLAEAARVLKPGGVLVANIVPYPALGGALSSDGTQPWSHLRQPDGAARSNVSVILNQWREKQYQAAFEKFFQVEIWQTEPDALAPAHLTPTVRAELADYAETELTCKQIMVLARRPA
jgi:ubiquinone/menaquinone biosynthesis C-methylase UbiE